jgi:hypothetical protein
MSSHGGFQEEWDADQLPSQYEELALNSFHVDFLNFGGVLRTNDAERDAARAGKKKNHVAIRVGLRDPIAETYYAVRISMDVVHESVGSMQGQYSGSNAGDDEKATIEGKVILKFLKYTGPSNRTICGFEFPLRNNLTLRDMLGVATLRHMQHFKFAVISGAYIFVRGIGILVVLSVSISSKPSCCLPDVDTRWSSG